jgi:hypothetical protein
MNDKELMELLDEIEENADGIFVRDNFEGRWKSYALTELPVNRVLSHAFSFIRGRISHPPPAPEKQ